MSDVPPSGPAPSSPPRSQGISTSLKPLLSNSDVTVRRLSKILSQTNTLDTALLTLSYTLTLVHGQLSRALTSNLTRIASRFAQKAQHALVPGEVVVASWPAPISLRGMATLEKSTGALARTISDFRVTMRLWGLVGIYVWGRGHWVSGQMLSEKSGKLETDGLLRKIVWGQILACALYQVLENAVHLAGKGVLSWDKKKQSSAGLLSVKFWAGYVALEYGRLWRVRRLVRSSSSSSSSSSSEKSPEVEAWTKQDEDAWWRALCVNAAYTPLVYHWSFAEGVLGESAVGALGAIAGFVRLRQIWQTTTV